MQLLAVLKPDGTLRRAAGANMLTGLNESGLCNILTFRKVHATTELLERHYQHISGRTFYNWLINYIASGPSYAMLVEAEPENIWKLRDLLGSTRAHEAKLGTLRFENAPYGGANCVHLSDSQESANVEVILWKDYFKLLPGQFDMPIEEYIRRYINGPNNTKAVRNLCIEIASKGRPILQADEHKLRLLLKEECVDATEEEFDSLVTSLREGCYY